MSRFAGLWLAVLLTSGCASSPPPTAEIDLAVARALADGGLHELALRQLQELDARGPEAWRLRGQCLDRLGQAEAAQAAFRRALREDPDRADLHNDLGFSLLAAGDRAGAEQHLAQALALDPELRVARTNLAVLRVLQGDEAAALALLGDETPAGALADLGALLELAGQPERARARYREALALDPERASARANLSRLEPDEGAPR